MRHNPNRCSSPSGLQPIICVPCGPLVIETNLEHLAKAELANEEENFSFQEALRRHDPQMVDTIVQRLNDEVTPQIDCTACGNCCKTLMINVTQPEVENLSAHLDMPQEKLKEKYVETSLQGNMIINSMPCHFLKDKKCSIYEHRFAECRNFPGLHNPNFTGRLFATFMHYGRCPIIYNVIEQLKIELDFTSSTISQ